jgi:FkbM family methyltransferase
VWLVGKIAAVYYRFIFPPLIIRPGTSDINVFISIFILGDLRLKINFMPELIIDAGAYTGISALYYSSIFPDAKIVAIEPELSNFEVLEKNTKKIKNIDRIHAGLWNWDANLKINARETGKWGFTVKEVVANEAFDVKGVTVETVLEKTGQEEIDILKIDIEGSEKEVFEKNTQGWINRVKVLVVELHDRYKPGCTEAVLKAIDMNKWHRYQKGDKTIFVRKDVAGY